MSIDEHHVSIASPPDREKLVAMIDFGDEQWAELNQDSGDLVIELYARQDGSPWVFRFSDTVDTLLRARDRLLNGT